MSAFNKQVDGIHYVNQVIQPFKLAYLVADGDAGFCKFVKYLSRNKGDKKANLEKAIHITQLTEEIFKICSKEFPDITIESLTILQAATNTLGKEVDPESYNGRLLMLYVLFLSNDFESCIEGIQNLIEEQDGS